MFGRISTGWSIVKQSWSVLRLDKELMLFPVLSSLACIVVAASFVAPFLVVPEWGRAVMQGLDEGQAVPIWKEVWVYVVLFAFYFVNYFVIVFFNTALVSCAVIRFRGGDPTMGDGFRAAGSRLPQIVGWAFVAATVGLVLQMIESRSKLVGQIVARVIGLLWSIATYLVVPVLAVERLGPIGAVRRSASLLKSTWGESLTGNVAMGGITMLLALPAIIGIPVLLVASVMLQVIPLGVAGVAIGIVYLIGLSIVMSTLQQIFVAGVYTYAAQGAVPAGFAATALRSAFQVKGS